MLQFFLDRKNELDMRKIRAGMQQRAFLEGTSKAEGMAGMVEGTPEEEEWARSALDKKTEVRNFRTDEITPETEDS